MKKHTLILVALIAFLISSCKTVEKCPSFGKIKPTHTLVQYR